MTDLEDRLRAFAKREPARGFRMTAWVRRSRKDWRVAIQLRSDANADVYVGIDDTYESALRAALDEAEKSNA